MGYRLLLFFCLSLTVFVTPYWALAQNKTLPDILAPKTSQDLNSVQALSNLDYKNCIKARSNALPHADAEYFCSCMVAQTPKFLSRDGQYKAYILKQDGWIKSKDHLLFQLYPDCMGDTIRQLSYAECYASFAKVPEFQKVDAICDCVADGFQAHIIEVLREGTGAYLMDEPLGRSPADLFFNMGGFASTSPALYRQCIRRHEYGWK